LCLRFISLLGDVFFLARAPRFVSAERDD